MSSNKTSHTRILVGGERSPVNRWIAIARRWVPHSQRVWQVICLLSLVGFSISLAYYAAQRFPATEVPVHAARIAFLPSLPRLKTVQATIPPSPAPAIDSFITEGGSRIIEHLPYREAAATDLMVIGSYGDRFERLQQEAGLAFLHLQDAGRRDGVWIIPISGFRDTARQDTLFQEQIKQTGTSATAARSVAPPGYSEHHTGYALDLADGLAKARDISTAFETTDAFRWLTRNAARFGFELSFPRNNSQGVDYEPWHWRFVGSLKARQIFAAARELY